MKVRIHCPNPNCHVSFGATEGGQLGQCPYCGWVLGSETSSGAGVSSSGGSGNPWVGMSAGTLLGGRYRIVKKLGEGGMGVVYLAEDRILHRKVALKVPHADVFERDPKFLERLEQEARIAANFNDSRICGIHDVGSADGWHYIVMEYIEGKTLEATRDGRALDPREAARLARGVAETLHEAHRRNIIHRDLKPSNLMFGPTGDLVVMDFGLAKRLDSDATRTSHGIFKGTPAYAAPEQILGMNAELGPACDIWALGVILYQLLAGRLPFVAAAKKPLMVQILNIKPDPPSTHVPEVGPALDAIVLRAIEKKPEDRFASMAEFAQALTDYLERKPVADDPDEVIDLEPSTELDPQPAADPGWSASSERSEHASTLGPAHLDSFESRTDYSSEETYRETAPEFVSPQTRMRMIWVPPGEFLMGSSDGEPDERPAHRVRISRAFFLGRCPVTQSEYQLVTSQSPSHFRGDPRNPVEQVTWLDAARFCNALSARDGFPPFYRVGDRGVSVVDWGAPGYRLPTEAEWEYACREGRRTSRFGFGDNEAHLPKHAWYAANSGQKTHPVGLLRANKLGLHDMHGNVWEWCWDWYDAKAYKKDEVDPRGPDTPRPFRVVRGGNWRDDPASLRSANRIWFEPTIRVRHIGFRVARTAD